MAGLSSGAAAPARSAAPVYDAVEPLFSSALFKKFAKDRDEPKMWLSAAAFLGITRNDAQHFDDRMRAVKGALKSARDWMDEIGAQQIHRGASGGGVAITRADIERLEDLVREIEKRFEVQIAAIRKAPANSSLRWRSFGLRTTTRN